MKLSPFARLGVGGLVALGLLTVAVPLAAARSQALHLQLAGSPHSVTVGGQVSYTATIRNGGQATVANAGFLDELPARAALVSASSSQGSCASGTPVVCNLGSLAAGASATVTIAATANAPVNHRREVVDRGFVSTNSPGHWRHEHVVVTRVYPAVRDLDLSLRGSPHAVPVGGQVTYTATISADGPAPVGDAWFRDDLPQKASFVSASASQGSCSSGARVICDLGSLGAGASATVTIVATANGRADDPGLMVDRGWVSGNPPGNWREGRLVRTFVYAAASQLGLHLSGSPGSLPVGGQVTYTGTITNDGPAAVASAGFRDDLPGKASLVSAAASQGSCASGSPVICSLGSLNAGASATVTVVVTANDAGVMVDRGFVSANPPGHWRHERAVFTRVASAVSQLGLHLSGSPGSLPVGGQVTYTGTITNDGPAAVASAGFRDDLPGKASLVSAAASQGSCASGSPVICSLGSLNAGASATVTVVVTANDAGVMVDRGFVSANPPGNWRHERLVATRVTQAVSDLGLRLSGSPPALTVGGQITYSATISNNGPATDASAAFRDDLPASTSLVSASASQGSCASGPPVICSLGSLSAGASATVTITATANAAGLAVDLGWVSTNAPGNWRHERIVVTKVRAAAANLRLQLSGSPGSLPVGGQVTYTGTVTNAGSSATSAAFRDQLPGKVSLVSITASQGSCSSSALVCDLGSLNAGASATVTITATANAAGLVVDRGWISTGANGPWSHEQLVVTSITRPATPATTTTTTGTTTGTATATQPSGLTLNLGLVGSSASVQTASQLTYTATIANSGPAAASSVTFQDGVPGKASLVSAGASQGSCTSGSTVVCSLGPLAAGASATVTIVVTANVAGTTGDLGIASATPAGHRVQAKVVTTVTRPPKNAPTVTTTTTAAPTPSPAP